MTKTKKMTYASLFIILSLLFGGLFYRVTGIPLSLKLNFGAARLTLDFTAIILASSGLILGVKYAILVGVAYDLIGYLLLQQGIWNPMFTLADVSVAVLPVIVIMWMKHHQPKPITKYVCVGLLMYGILTLMATSFLGIEHKLIIVTLSPFQIINMALFILVLASVGLTLVSFLYFNKKQSRISDLSFEKITIALFIGMGVRTLISGTALWVNTTFINNAPIPLSYFLFPRAVTLLLLASISTPILYALRQIIMKNAIQQYK